MKRCVHNVIAAAFVFFARMTVAGCEPSYVLHYVILVASFQWGRAFTLAKNIILIRCKMQQDITLISSHGPVTQIWAYKTSFKLRWYSDQGRTEAPLGPQRSSQALLLSAGFCPSERRSASSLWCRRQTINDSI